MQPHVQNIVISTTETQRSVDIVNEKKTQENVGGVELIQKSCLHLMPVQISSLDYECPDCSMIGTEFRTLDRNTGNLRKSVRTWK